MSMSSRNCLVGIRYRDTRRVPHHRITALAVPEVNITAIRSAGFGATKSIAAELISISAEPGFRSRAVSEIAMICGTLPAAPSSTTSHRSAEHTMTSGGQRVTSRWTSRAVDPGSTGTVQASIRVTASHSAMNAGLFFQMDCGASADAAPGQSGGHLVDEFAELP